MTAGGQPRAEVALVVAVARNGVIGRDGDLAWRISDDLKWFKKVTLGKPIIMGRKTFVSIGKALPGRLNIVVTRDKEFKADDVVVAHSLEEALKRALLAAKEDNVAEVCVIGGAMIYQQALPLADRLYLTEVDAVPEGDVHFPEFNPGDWHKRVEGKADKSEKNEFDATFFVLDRVN
ncbi:MAG: dihydrofolate reductase [Pseudomonadota bacterium]